MYLHYSGIHTGIRDSVMKVYDNFSKDYFENTEKNNERYDKFFHQAEDYLENISKQLTKLNLWEKKT